MTVFWSLFVWKMVFVACSRPEETQHFEFTFQTVLVSGSACRLKVGKSGSDCMCACLCVSEECTVSMIACCWKAEMARFQVLWVRLRTAQVWERKHPTNFIQTLYYCISFTFITWYYETTSVHQLPSATTFKQVISNSGLHSSSLNFLLNLIFCLVVHQHMKMYSSICLYETLCTIPDISFLAKH